MFATSVFFIAFLFKSWQLDFLCFSDLCSPVPCQYCLQKLLVNPVQLFILSFVLYFFLFFFLMSITSACLWPMGHIISSLSFRMIMLVFPVCHVLNYEYTNKNEKHNAKLWCPFSAITLTSCPVYRPHTLLLCISLCRSWGGVGQMAGEGWGPVCGHRKIPLTEYFILAQWWRLKSVFRIQRMFVEAPRSPWAPLACTL